MSADCRLNWLKHYFSDPLITPVSSDASHRQYFHIQTQDTSYILMDSSQEKSSLENFLAVYHQINAAIYVPKIYQSNVELGYLLLEYLGRTTLLDTPHPIALDYYYQALDDLNNLQKLTSNDLPNYDSILLRKELSLFPTWYLRKYQEYFPNENEITRLNEVFEILITQIQTQKQVVVHRDYHSRNIMLTPDKKLAYIDFQDAVIGAYTYDLCSLLKDAYYQLSIDELDKLLGYFYHKNPLKNYESFMFDFDMVSIQRQLKVLGIFARLAIRDNKLQYLDDIPLIKSYLLTTLKKYPQFNVIVELLKQ